MENDDAVLMALESMEMVLEDGQVMTLNRLADIAEDWSSSARQTREVLAEIWS